MKHKSILLTLVFLGFAAVGCGDKEDEESTSDTDLDVTYTGISTDDDDPPGSGDDDEDDDDDTGDPADDGDTDEATGVPDPGEEYAPLRWYDDGGYHGTPETAQVMGVVLNVPDYIQGGVDPVTGNHYFVFRTFADQTEFWVDLFDKTSDIESVHIHDATGLEFGDEVPPRAVSSSTEVEWDLEGDTIYVLEVHSPTGGFF